MTRVRCCRGCAAAVTRAQDDDTILIVVLVAGGIFVLLMILILWARVRTTPATTVVRVLTGQLGVTTH